MLRKNKEKRLILHRDREKKNNLKQALQRRVVLICFYQRSEVKDIIGPVLLGHRSDLKIAERNPCPQ